MMVIHTPAGNVTRPLDKGIPLEIMALKIQRIRDLSDAIAWE